MQETSAGSMVQASRTPHPMSPRTSTLLDSGQARTQRKGIHMDGLNELELTRRGFTVLAASAFGAFFIKPGLADGLSPNKTYLVSVKTTGYEIPLGKGIRGYRMDGRPRRGGNSTRSVLDPGSILYFEQDPEIPKDAAWLDVVSADGEQLC